MTAGTLFSGTVNNFGTSDTIVVNGFTSTSNATLTTVGGVVELITQNGTVATTITLTGTVSNEITTGTNSSGQEYIQSGATTLSGGSNNLGSSGSSTTVANATMVTLTGSSTELTVYDSLTGSGGYFIDHGATLALDNPAGNDVGQTVSFGTNGSTSAPNTFILNDNTTGFGGTISNFGANDVVFLGGSVLPAFAAGDGYKESYSGNVVTVIETNASGATLGSTALTMTGTTGAAFGAGSLMVLDGANGAEIELTSSLPTSFTFTGASNSAFETNGNFTGGIAPGDDIIAGDTVSIITNTASVTGSALIDNGQITVSSTLIDKSALTGTGTLSVLSGGKASLTGGAALGLIKDALAHLTLGGNVSGPISLSSGAQVSIASAFTDSGTFGPAP